MPRSTTRKTLVFFLLILASGFSADAAEIQLKRNVTSQGSLILLGDIAAVLDSDPKVISSLERIELFPAPAVGRARTVRVREVRELLRLNGVDLAACQFSGVETTRIVSRPITKPAKVFSSNPITPPKPTDTIVVTARPLKRGELVSQADIAIRPVTDTTRRIAAIRGGATFHQMSDVVGFEMTRAVGANQPLEARMLRRPLLVRRGDAIQVISRAAGVTVRTTARATQEGALGELVMLQSEENREKYLALVTGLRQAEVYASGTVVGSPPAVKADRRSKNGSIRSPRR